jgi:hypothetical protein
MTWLLPPLPKDLALYTIWHPDAERTIMKVGVQSDSKLAAMRKAQKRTPVACGRRKFGGINEAARATGHSTISIRAWAEAGKRGWRLL